MLDLDNIDFKNVDVTVDEDGNGWLIEENDEAMLAAMALCADGVQMCSRFVASDECSAHINFKNKVWAKYQEMSRQFNI